MPGYTKTVFSRIARNVSDLAEAQKFYCKFLGFTPVGGVTDDPALANLLRVERLRRIRLRLGAQEIEFSECSPAGAPYPAPAAANDPWFQHIAIVTSDMEAAYAQLKGTHGALISPDGPVSLPGLRALKFRDPDGHPLELLQFDAGHGNPAWGAKNRLMLGYDHTAITVSNLHKSLEFYDKFGFAETARQFNQGAAQDALDGLCGTQADVVTLRLAAPTPHLELLHYRQPSPARPRPIAPGDLAATRLVLASATPGLLLRRDPDGHIVISDGRAAKHWA
jgi:catechol 2,3-dioxygenase-like lactoylglutathione lyase family enzyme